MKTGSASTGEVSGEAPLSVIWVLGAIVTGCSYERTCCE